MCGILGKLSFPNKHIFQAIENSQILIYALQISVFAKFHYLSPDSVFLKSSLVNWACQKTVKSLFWRFLFCQNFWPNLIVKPFLKKDIHLIFMNFSSATLQDFSSNFYQATIYNNNREQDKRFQNLSINTVVWRNNVRICRHTWKITACCPEKTCFQSISLNGFYCTSQICILLWLTFLNIVLDILIVTTKSI